MTIHDYPSFFYLLFLPHFFKNQYEYIYTDFRGFFHQIGGNFLCARSNFGVLSAHFGFSQSHEQFYFPSARSWLVYGSVV